jgi:hypothetical protein
MNDVTYNAHSIEEGLIKSKNLFLVLYILKQKIFNAYYSIIFLFQKFFTPPRN